MITDRVYFLHIPKTAGTSFNDYLQGFFPKHRSIHHIEMRKDWKDEAFWDRHDLVTGHIAWSKLQEFEALKSFAKFTFLREPQSHFVSHLKYLYAIEEDHTREVFSYIKGPLRDFSKELHQVDFLNPAEVSEFMGKLNGVGLFLLDNYQARFLSNVIGYEKVTSKHVPAALETLKHMQFVGITERMEESINYLKSITGWNSDHFSIGQKNKSPSRLKMIEMAELRPIIKPYIEHDLILYDFANRRFDDLVKYNSAKKNLQREGNHLLGADC